MGWSLETNQNRPFMVLLTTLNMVLSAAHYLDLHNVFCTVDGIFLKPSKVVDVL